jgi:hypothetical protein
MSYFEAFLNFISDERIRFSSKTLIVIFSLTTIFLVDNIFGFSYYYTTGKKIENVLLLNRIINDTTTDSTTKLIAKNLRKDILARKNILNQSVLFFRNIKLINSKTNQTNPINDADKTDSNTRNNFWFHLSSSGLFYLLGITLLPIMFFVNPYESLLQRIATSIFTTLMFMSFGLVFYWICDFIPQLYFKTWFWNYLLNFVLQLIPVLSIIIYGNKMGKK